MIYEPLFIAEILHAIQMIRDPKGKKEKSSIKPNI